MFPHTKSTGQTRREFLCQVPVWCGLNLFCRTVSCLSNVCRHLKVVPHAKTPTFYVGELRWFYVYLPSASCNSSLISCSSATVLSSTDRSSVSAAKKSSWIVSPISALTPVLRISFCAPSIVSLLTYNRFFIHFNSSTSSGR